MDFHGMIVQQQGQLYSIYTPNGMLVCQTYLGNDGAFLLDAKCVQYTGLPVKTTSEKIIVNIGALSYGAVENRDKQDCLGDNGTSCEAASIQVKDMVLKDAVEERRRRNEEMLANS